MKSEKLLQILIKLLNPQILFCKSQTNLQIQNLSPNPEKYFANPKKYLGSIVNSLGEYHEIYMNVRTLRKLDLILGPGLLTFLLKPA